MRHINEIVVHCSATRPEWMAGGSIEEKRHEIKLWHMSRNPPFRREGYHHFIDRDGSECAGRPDSMVGAHVRGRNANTLSVCLIGGRGSSATDAPSDNFTLAQLEALEAHIHRKMKEYPTIHIISGHNQYANKACPGFNVPRWWNSVKNKPKTVIMPTAFPSKLSWWQRIFGK